MSIDKPRSNMASENHKSKSGKKQKSSHVEKKRKRDPQEEVHRHKSKKHRTDETAAAEVTIPSHAPPFQVQISSLYLPLSPVSQRYPVEGLCAEHLSPLILQWYPPFSGVILSYTNPRISAEPFGNDGKETLLQNIDEYAASWAWVTAEFLLFKPDLESIVEGYVNLQNESHLGLVCWNLFNASIDRKRLPQDWKWIGIETLGRGEEGMGMEKTYAEDGAGYYVDGEGAKIDGLVKFRIRDVETDVDREKSFLSLAGTMLDVRAEKKLVETELAKTKPGVAVGRRIGGSSGMGVTRLDVPVEE